MNNFKMETKNRKSLLKDVIRKKTNSLKNAPPGNLKICGKSYYTYLEGSRKCTYLSRKDSDQIKRLAQKSYDLEILRLACAELSSLENGRIYEGETFEEVFPRLNQKRQALVIPVVLTDKMYTEAWESRPYEKRGFKEGTFGYKTEKGDLVRSKSEVIIANCLFHCHIPYLYEFPVTLASGRIFHPDFSILDIKNRKTLYWEHFGMMDKPEYADNATAKLNELAKSGIHIGDNLLITMETSKIPLDTETIYAIIRPYLQESPKDRSKS